MAGKRVHRRQGLPPVSPAPVEPTASAPLEQAEPNEPSPPARSAEAAGQNGTAPPSGAAARSEWWARVRAGAAQTVEEAQARWARSSGSPRDAGAPPAAPADAAQPVAALRRARAALVPPPRSSFDGAPLRHRWAALGLASRGQDVSATLRRAWVALALAPRGRAAGRASSATLRRLQATLAAPMSVEQEAPNAMALAWADRARRPWVVVGTASTLFILLLIFGGLSGRLTVPPPRAVATPPAA